MRRPPTLVPIALTLMGLLVLPWPVWAQGKSQQAPGRQRGNPNPGKGRDHGGRSSHSEEHSDWKSWDQERWREYNHRVDDTPWSRPVRINPYTYRPNWATRNWNGDRPWPTGWYGTWNQPPWGWWPGQKAAWGVGSLAATSLINQALNQAIGYHQPTLLVPSTPWRLVYGSVQPVGYGAVGFVVSNGTSYYQMTASCDSGLLNGQVPSSYGQAQLLHAACQVAYGGPAY